MRAIDGALAEGLAVADVLTPYGVEFRYPGELEPVTVEQGRQARQLAQQVRRLVSAHLKDYLDAGRPVAAD